jgi:desulfoferrodoxin-like iron-binding protein
LKSFLLLVAQRAFVGVVFGCVIFLSSSYVIAKDAPAEETLNTPLEKLHKPKVRTPETVNKNELFFISVQVGDRLHPMSEEHLIEWIEASVDGQKVFQARLTPLMGEARMTFPLRLKKSAQVKVEAHCNLHGTWADETEVKVKHKLF